jgi:acyl-CoA reductase-like NAD-dependent aldehyde dehydrogenase
MTSTASAGPGTVVDPSSLLTRRRTAHRRAAGADGRRGDDRCHQPGHRAPWGGYRHSGFGRTMSAESVLDYTQIKTVVINA